MTNHSLLKVNGLKKYYLVTTGLLSRHVGEIKALDGVSFSINETEILGLVGESGCGKSTLGRTILRLEEPTAGEIWYQDLDVTRLGSKELRAWRRKAQMIFQDPQASLDPRMTVGDSIGEALVICGVNDEAERLREVTRLLEMVGLEAEIAMQYPHELSGGQKQRIGIARALALNPKLIIADEPVSALDVSVQAQILNLIADLQEKLGLSYLFIAHDLSVIRHISHRVAVMYLGKIVELAVKEEIFKNACHPYTEALLSAVTTLRKIKKGRILLSGDVPSPLNPPSGCRFRTRCHRRLPICEEEEPKPREIVPEHIVFCHLYD